MKTFISSNPSNLSSMDLDATVEAEYGSVVVKGEFLTLAHHGERAHNPAPCVAAVPPVQVSTIGLSHFDLDTLGGVMVVTDHPAAYPSNAGFWHLAAFVDVNGAHRLHQANASDEDVRKLQAFWAWSMANRYFPPRDGSVADCTEFVQKAMEVVAAILAGDETLLAAGDANAEKQASLETQSFQRWQGDVLVRKSDAFVNHMYEHEGRVAQVVIAFNTKTKAITVSAENPTVQLNCCALVQSLWGPEAGGHKGIAGSPRNQEMTEADFEAAINAVDTQCA